LHVHVYDNGDGVSDTDLDRMFDEVGFTTSGGGTGLALIMREIENKHGGKVYPARHAEEGGVEIHYSLPSAHYIAK
jgi:signal transduction histidine kinase